MRKFLFIITVFSLFFVSSFANAATQERFYSSPGINVFVNGQLFSFDQKPAIVNNTILLPLSETAKSLGAAVQWDQYAELIKIQKDKKELTLSLDSNQVGCGRQVFFMEQIPAVINGHAMVTLRFVSDVLGADVSWDVVNQNLNIIANGKFLELPQAQENSEEVTADKYYRLYDGITGPTGGPEYNEARNYVLENGLLKEIQDIQRNIYTRFEESAQSVTMVSGIDNNNQERLIWLSQDLYMGEISVCGNILKDSGLSQEAIISLLKEKGINESSIKKLYVGPYVHNQIVWFALAEQEDKTYYYCFDFLTGSVVFKYIGDSRSGLMQE